MCVVVTSCTVRANHDVMVYRLLFTIKIQTSCNKWQHNYLLCAGANRVPQHDDGLDTYTIKGREKILKGQSGQTEADL